VAIELQMPKIGLTMTEGKVVEWRKRVGERIEKGEVIFVFETEKTTYDVEAPAAGVLARIVVEEDDTAPVGAVVGLIADHPGEETAQGARPAASAPPAAPRAPAATATPEGRLVRPSPMRRAIAERMTASRREAAQTEMVLSIDASALLAARDELAPAVEAEAGARLTVTDLVVKVTAAAVAAHPDVNTRWTADGILYLDAIHVGLALALDDGLVVPVLRDAGTRTLAQVTRARAELVERGRSGRLGPDELKGSTITISSLGMLGVEEFTAILNPPETAILAVGAIADRPVVVEKKIVVRPVMKVTLSYDHRVLDGAAAARFLGKLRELAESPRTVLAPP
jgi:pyruvate dehydrogenase E2 component (dihydrolipoamide acetyltransferase)